MFLVIPYGHDRSVLRPPLLTTALLIVYDADEVRRNRLTA
jgi:hypothetical protein